MKRENGKVIVGCSGCGGPGCVYCTFSEEEWQSILDAEVNVSLGNYWARLDDGTWQEYRAGEPYGEPKSDWLDA